MWKAEKRLDVINIREWSEKYSASRWIEIKEEKKTRCENEKTTKVNEMIFYQIKTEDQI